MMLMYISHQWIERQGYTDYFGQDLLFQGLEYYTCPTSSRILISKLTRQSQAQGDLDCTMAYPQFSPPTTPTIISPTPPAPTPAAAAARASATPRKSPSPEPPQHRRRDDVDELI
jgi:hypothetical protein